MRDIRCIFGHRYNYRDAVVTMVIDNVCRVEFNCERCGKHVCFLANSVPSPNFKQEV